MEWSMLLWSLALASPLVQAHGPARAVDVDGDGWVDIAIGTMESVYYNDGGSFGPLTPFSLDVWADGAIMADLDGDGLPDLCTFSFQAFACFKGFGRSVGPELYRESRTAFAALSVDADGDGDLDVLTSTVDGMVLLSNDGTGNLTSKVLHEGRIYQLLVTGDVDGDGDLDVVAATTTNDDVLWLERDDGVLGTPTELIAPPYTASQIDLADYDADGRPDLLSRFNISEVRVRLQDEGRIRDDDSSDTAYWRPDPGQRFGATVDLPYSGVFSVTDLDGNGAQDLVVADPLEGNLLWDPQISSTPQVVLPLIHGAVGVGVQGADVDLDGAQDLLTIDRDLRVVLDPLGSLSARTLQRGAEALGPVTAADIDGDGRDDVVYSDSDTHAIYVLPSLGDGRFGPFESIGEETEPSSFLEAFDVDRDATDDLLVTTVSGDLAWYPNPTAGGDGARTVLATGVTTLSAVLDPDADGHLERLVVGVDGSVAWLDHDGGGQVSVGSPFLTLTDPRAVSHGDLDGDGIDELVFLDGDELVLLRNGPYGFVEEGRILGPGREPYDVMIGDHDGDGRASVLAAALCEYGYAYDSPRYPYCRTGNRLHEVSDATGQLVETGWVGNGQPPFLRVDWENDGTLDLVGVDLLALGVFRPDEVFDWVIWGVPDSLVAADLDGDGDDDLLLGMENGVEVVWNGFESSTAPTTRESWGDTGSAGSGPSSSAEAPLDTARPRALASEPSTACGCSSTQSAGLVVLLPLLGWGRRRAL